MNNLLLEHPKLLSSSDLMKINRCVSYLTFILKEFNDYSTAKLPDGTPVYQLRKAKADLGKLTHGINTVKDYLNQL